MATIRENSFAKIRKFNSLTILKIYSLLKNLKNDYDTGDDRNDKIN
ncbi:MAG TPA: hypothetical protein VI894_03175 [Candidatus Nanoarchaeia archaeon]|nr:hypothetical protein [Candidatus Nanoarchaeia archaeon]